MICAPTAWILGRIPATAAAVRTRVRADTYATKANAKTLAIVAPTRSGAADSPIVTRSRANAYAGAPTTCSAWAGMRSAIPSCTTASVKPGSSYARPTAWTRRPIPVSAAIATRRVRSARSVRTACAWTWGTVASTGSAAPASRTATRSRATACRAAQSTPNAWVTTRYAIWRAINVRAPQGSTHAGGSACPTPQWTAAGLPARLAQWGRTGPRCAFKAPVVSCVTLTTSRAGMRVARPSIRAAAKLAGPSAASSSSATRWSSVARVTIRWPLPATPAMHLRRRARAKRRTDPRGFGRLPRRV